MKFTARFLLAAMLLGAAFAQTQAAALDTVRVFVNGNELVFTDSQPFRDSNGSNLVPARAIAGAMGCSLEWDGDAGSVTLKRGRITAAMVIGSEEYCVLGVNKPMNAAAIIRDGRALIPVRYIAEAFGAAVVWDESEKTINITDEGKDIYRLGGFVLDIGDTDVLGNNSDGLLTITRRSGLVLDERQSGEGKRQVIAAQITMDAPGKNAEDQREEAGALLRQCLDGELVDEIMGCAAMKEDSRAVIERKYFKDEKYRIYVTGYVGPVVIYIYL